MRYNVTSKDLAKKIKKDGTISKVNDIKATYKAGNIIVTNFGEFVAVGAEQIIHTSASGKQYKQWMVTLKNSSGTYKMTHNQAHKNKKMPKSAKLQQVIAGLLPAPMELIDQILEYANIFVINYKQQQLENPSNYNRRGQLKNNIKIKKTWEEFKLTVSQQWLEDPINLFGHKVHFIDICCRLGWKQSKKLYRQLLQYYHPDHNLNYPTQYLEKLNWLNH